MYSMVFILHIPPKCSCTTYARYFAGLCHSALHPKTYGHDDQPRTLPRMGFVCKCWNAKTKRPIMISINGCGTSASTHMGIGPVRPLQFVLLDSGQISLNVQVGGRQNNLYFAELLLSSFLPNSGTHFIVTPVEMCHSCLS
jgi:hypothetical protein